MAGEGVEFESSGARGADEAARSWAGQERGVVGMRRADRAFEAVVSRLLVGVRSRVGGLKAFD